MKYQLFEDVKAELRLWNIDSVAKEANVARATIYFWLDGKTKKPRLDTITKVADVIGMDLRAVRRRVELRLVK